MTESFCQLDVILLRTFPRTDNLTRMFQEKMCPMPSPCYRRLSPETDYGACIATVLTFKDSHRLEGESCKKAQFE